ncbi:MAG: hypothetical protein M0Z54_12000 [Thermaerobacter sp.]|nr:hypothetical protein [Thermaerobacter sp.]
MKLAYAVVRVRDLPRMAAWYERLLGQPPDRRRTVAELATDPWVQFTFVGGAALALQGVDPLADVAFGGAWDRGAVYLACPVMQVVYRLRAADERVEGPEVDGPLLQAVVVDPEGNRVRLIEWLSNP